MWRHRGSGVLAVGLFLAGGCATNGPDADPSRDRSTGTLGSGVLVIAHRGASAYAPKDTLPAVRAAAGRGADVVEVDIRQTRDRELVALFSGSLADTTNVEKVYPNRKPWRVESFTLAEIRRLDAGSWFDPSFAETKVPTLSQVIDTVQASGIGLIVEAKAPQRYPGIGRRIVRELRSHPGLLSRDGDERYVEIESFDWKLLRRLGRMEPRVTIGLTGRPTASRLKHHSDYADAVNPQHASVGAAYVDRAHSLGLDVKVWSVNDRDPARRSVNIGVDGIYSHRPDLIQQVLTKSARQ